MVEHCAGNRGQEKQNRCTGETDACNLNRGTRTKKILRGNIQEKKKERKKGLAWTRVVSCVKGKIRRRNCREINEKEKLKDSSGFTHPSCVKRVTKKKTVKRKEGKKKRSSCSSSVKWGIKNTRKNSKDIKKRENCRGFAYHVLTAKRKPKTKTKQKK